MPILGTILLSDFIDDQDGGIDSTLSTPVAETNLGRGGVEGMGTTVGALKGRSAI